MNATLAPYDGRLDMVHWQTGYQAWVAILAFWALTALVYHHITRIAFNE